MRSRKLDFFFSLGAVVLVVLVFSAFKSASSFAFGTTCTGDGFNTPHGGQLTLTCAGSCTGEAEVCKAWSKTQTGQTYLFCGCNANDEETCCHLVVFTPTDGTARTKGVKGTCPPCPSGGTNCRLNGDQPDCTVTPG